MVMSAGRSIQAAGKKNRPGKDKPQDKFFRLPLWAGVLALMALGGAVFLIATAVTASHQGRAGATPPKPSVAAGSPAPAVPVPVAQVRTVHQVCQDFRVMSGYALAQMLESKGADGPWMQQWVYLLNQPWNQIAAGAGVNAVGNLAGDMSAVAGDFILYNASAGDGFGASLGQAAQDITNVTTDCGGL